MKKYAVVILLPLLLWGLETVNLIKDHSFEKDSEVWNTYTGRSDGEDADSMIACRHDSLRFYDGLYSGSCDTRKEDDAFVHYDSAVIIQGYLLPKLSSDFDSLTLHYAVSFYMDISFFKAGFAGFYLNAGSSDAIVGGYLLDNPEKGQFFNVPTYFWDQIEISSDTEWHYLVKNVAVDLAEYPTATVDSFILMGLGGWTPPWRGQKVYWDDVRLMGYADYDVGVKEILSGDSLEVGEPYQPEARIKNFGREPADTFLAIAEIEDSTNLIYVDTIPYSLPPDTSEIITFADFIPSATGPYTLTIHTHMEPDESDADDELSKPIGQVAIAERPFPEGFSFKIESFTTVQFSVPYATHVSLKVYDIAGRLVTRMIDDEVRAGTHSYRWAGQDDVGRRCASGVYFVRFVADDYVASKKMVLIK